MGKLLKKEVFKSFISGLMKDYEIIAPVKTDILRFMKISEPGQIHFEGNAMFPLKKYLLGEQLFSINEGKLGHESKSARKKLIFGARLCDLNGIMILDKFFLDAPIDDYYKDNREKLILIGLNCKKPASEYCFCESMELADYYDLFLHDLGEAFYIEIGTEKGMALVKGLPDYSFEIPKIRCDKSLEKKDINDLFDEKHWADDAALCVSCQRCTTLCPTCLCFDIKDDMDETISNGVRKRNLDSCHSKDFTEVAGGFVFRDKRLYRYRHRIFHKIQWFKEKYGIPMCTGCGRCIQYCHSKIDWVRTINESE